jgi:D-altronate dehydratase (EC 4.2.1.7)
VRRSPRGAHVHVHNLKTALGDILDYQYAGNVSARPQNGGPVPTISAYERANGDIGIRNDLWIVPLVGCINGLADNIAKAVEKEGMLPEGSKVTVLSHPYGCSQLGDDLANTRGILQNYVAHPNAGGVLVLVSAARTTPRPTSNRDWSCPTRTGCAS